MNKRKAKTLEDEILKSSENLISEYACKILQEYSNNFTIATITNIVKELVKNTINQTILLFREKMELAEKKYSNLFKDFSVWMLILDEKTWEFIETNDSFLKMFNFWTIDLEDVDIKKLFKDFSLTENETLELLENDSGASFEFSTKTKSWKDKWFMVCSKSVNNNRLLSFVDITKYKEIEKISTDAMSFMAHDIRWYLQVPVGYSGIILENLSPNDENKDYIIEVINGLSKLEDFLNIYLNIVKIELWTFEPWCDLINVFDFLLEYIKKFNKMKICNGPEIKISEKTLNKFAKSNICILWDKKCIEQILFNKFKNAKEAAKSFVEIDFEVENSHILINTHNDWDPIPKNIQETLFTQKSTKTTKKSWHWIWTRSMQIISNAIWWEVFVVESSWVKTTICLKIPTNLPTKSEENNLKNYRYYEKLIIKNPQQYIFS